MTLTYRLGPGSWVIGNIEGGAGTYDELYLYKGFELVKKWDWLERVPNIFEMEEVIKSYESRY